MRDLQVTPPLEPLLEHAAWLRRLAARLVAGPHDADDVVQEVWRATLAAGRTDVRAPRAWLAGALRNVLKMRGRGEARRSRREQERQPRVEVPSAAELAGEQDVRRMLLEHVDALPAGEREVVLLRFYQDLPPRDVATRLGIPVNTVRSRTARALQRLRERLDDQHGDRRSWCLSLVPLLDPRGLQAVGVGEATRRSTTLLLGAAIATVAVGGYLGLQAWTARRIVDLEQTTSADRALDRFAAAPPSDAVSLRAAAPGTAQPFVGRVVDLDGRAIEGATLSLQDRMVGNRIVDIGDREQWTRRTGADGRFGFDADTLPLVAGKLKIGEVEHPDYEAELGHSLWTRDDAPVLRMRRAFDTVVDVEVVQQDTGEPVWFAATAFASWGHDSTPGVLRVGDPTRRSVSSSPDGGAPGRLRFAMRVVAGASNTVRLSIPGSRDHERTLEPPTAHGHVYRIRERVRIDAAAADPDKRVLQGRVTDAVSGEPIPMARVALLREWSEGRWSYSNRQPTQTRSDGRYRLGYAPEYVDSELLVEHDDYLDLRVGFDGEALRDCKLRRRPSLVVRVQHAGRPLGDVPVMMIHGDHSHRARATSDADGRIDFGLVNTQRVVLYVLPRLRAADEQAILSRAVRLEAGGADEVVLELRRPDRVAVFGNIPPAPGGIALVPTLVPLEEGRGWIAARRLGVSGYEAGDVQRGRYLVMLAPADDRHVDGPFGLCGVVEIDGVVRQALDLALPTGRIHGRVVGVERREGLRVVALPVLEAGSAATEQLLSSPKLAECMGAELAPDGFFFVENVPDGVCRVELRRGVEVVASRRVEVVAGEATVGDWRIGG
ncbi:MAG: sigma-70 family RNA polymerase sigma factor [Planctomycetota bacterium]